MAVFAASEEGKEGELPPKVVDNFVLIRNGISKIEIVVMIRVCMLCVFLSEMLELKAMPCL